MIKITHTIKKRREIQTTNQVVNFMGGYSYEINPIDTLKLVTASSIFGEPQYYRHGAFANATITDAFYRVDPLFAEYAILTVDKYNGMKTSSLMEKVIDEALDYDYEATLNWAVTLRKEYLMRLNPQVIMVRAALSDKRIEFTQKNPSKFAEINKIIMSRADDVIAQLSYYLFITGSKRNMPMILKRSWAKKIESLSKYELYKYKNHGIGLIDVIRICHAHNNDIDELMKTGNIIIPEDNKTWEALRASGMPWLDILNTLHHLPHMAALRNLRGIFNEIDDYEMTNAFMNNLISGVKTGKQFPFRYMSAKQAVMFADVNNKMLISDKLEECLDVACDNLPHLKGNNVFLSDNSGSAWGVCISEYGTVTVGEIDNLSAVIGAANSDKGTVIKFGDIMVKYEISKRTGILQQASEISKDRGIGVGHSTENGIWLFFEEAINEQIFYDNIFIYSDMQAGHGGLYGTPDGIARYTEQGFAYKKHYIDVNKMIKKYRSKVNPKVNIYCIQTAGYTNVVVPENGYRTSILYGWTGKELVYADMINKFWDQKDLEHNK